MVMTPLITGRGPISTKEWFFAGKKRTIKMTPLKKNISTCHLKSGTISKGKACASSPIMFEELCSSSGEYSPAISPSKALLKIFRLFYSGICYRRFLQAIFSPWPFFLHGQIASPWRRIEVGDSLNHQLRNDTRNCWQRHCWWIHGNMPPTRIPVTLLKNSWAIAVRIFGWFLVSHVFKHLFWVLEGLNRVV